MGWLSDQLKARGAWDALSESKKKLATLWDEFDDEDAEELHQFLLGMRDEPAPKGKSAKTSNHK